MAFSKSFLMHRRDDLETKGCHRYQFIDGQAGVETVYLRKEHLDGEEAPEKIRVTISEA